MLKSSKLYQKSRDTVTSGFENLRFCKEKVESCIQTRKENLREKEKHEREIVSMKSIIANLTKILNIKTEREKHLAERLESMRYFIKMNEINPFFQLNFCFVRLLNNQERYERNEGKN